MIFSHAYLHSIGDARLVYIQHNAMAERRYPAPVGAAVDAEWDADTLTLTCTYAAGHTEVFTITEQDIEDAKQTEAL